MGCNPPPALSIINTLAWAAAGATTATPRRARLIAAHLAIRADRQGVG